MAHMLLVNPAKRRRVRRNPSKAKRKTTTRRRRNPLFAAPVRRRVRRHARRAVARVRRRRNPISMGGVKGGAKGIMQMLTDALIGGLGALGVDVIFGKVNPMLPASMQSTPTSVGVGDAVKMGLTIGAGLGLKRLTKGLSVKLAQGALTVQFRDIASTMLPAGMTVAGLGYFTPGRVVNATARIGPNQAITRGTSPLLNRYMRPGVTPLLNARQPGFADQRSHAHDTAMREGVRFT